MENNVVTESPAKKLLGILSISILLGILFDYFFYHKMPGISFPIYMAIMVGGLALITEGFKKHKGMENIWMIIPVLLFAGLVAVRDNPSLTALNILTSLFCLFLFIDSLSGKKVTSFLLKDYITSFLVIPISFIENSFKYLGELFKLKNLIKGHKTAGQVLKGVIMAIPVLLLFIGLFSSADLVFKQMVQNTTSFHVSAENISRIITIGTISIIFMGMFFLAQSGKKENIIPDEKNPEKGKNQMETIQISIFLGLICALFLCFIMIQVTYLFGGNQNISIEGYTYAEYARKGFFELIWVAIFSYLIMLISEKIVERKENKHSMAFKILSTTLILEVVIIMIAAFMRLSLYEDAYGFTQLRFYSHAFIVWLGIIFVLLAVKIHVHQKEGIHLFETFVSSLVFLGAINIMNPDGFIARQNINRMTNPNLVDLDTEYLRNLSEDAIPELIPLLDSDNEYVRKQTGNSLWEIREKKRQHPEEYNQWQSWNFSRNAADNSLNSLGAALETYKHEYYDEDYRYSDGKGG